MPEDHGSHAERDAAAWDRAHYGPVRRARSPYSGEDVPSKSELDAEEAGL